MVENERAIQEQVKQLKEEIRAARSVQNRLGNQDMSREPTPDFRHVGASPLGHWPSHIRVPLGTRWTLCMSLSTGFPPGSWTMTSWTSGKVVRKTILGASRVGRRKRLSGVRHCWCPGHPYGWVTVLPPKQSRCSQLSLSASIPVRRS